MAQRKTTASCSRPLLALAKSMDTPCEVLAGLRQAQLEAMTRGDGRAVFLAAYADTTERILTSLRAGRFEDPDYVCRAVVLFAKLYRHPANAYGSKAESASVPQSWRIAFDAARSETHSVRKNLMLGINAHMRDLAYAVDMLERETPGGNVASDYFAINASIDVAMRRTRRWISRTYGSSPVLTVVPAHEIVMEYVRQRRCQAWRFGKRLAATNDVAARNRVVREIERHAAIHARALQWIPVP